jgi:hypothetical protein
MFIFLSVNVFTLDSSEHYLRSRNRALPQDSHSLRGSTRDLWTVRTMVTAYKITRRQNTADYNQQLVQTSAPKLIFLKSTCSLGKVAQDSKS